MDDYDSFCQHAQVFTEIHARPNQRQKELIIQHNLAEEKKEAEEKAKSATQPKAASAEISSEAIDSNLLISKQAAAGQTPV